MPCSATCLACMPVQTSSAEKIGALKMAATGSPVTKVRSQIAPLLPHTARCSQVVLEAAVANPLKRKMPGAGAPGKLNREASRLGDVGSEDPFQALRLEHD